MPAQSAYLTEDQAAETLHVAPRTLQRWRVTGDGPAFCRIGPRRVAYRSSDVDAWAAGRIFAHRADELARAGAR